MAKISSRGASINPAGRFESLNIELDEEEAAEHRKARTSYLRDDSQSIISFNDSPDLSFRASVNPYRGCEHGCSYCYARPTHEYLGFSAGLDFETRILIKPDAPELLIKELTSPKWKPQAVMMSGVTDCYQPVERKLEITRRCLRVLADFLNPVALVTKNHLVTRDIDYLTELAAHQACSVHISVTTLDAGLARRLEPRASMPGHRLDAIAQLSAAGIPVGVLVAPVIPGLNEQEIPAILKAVREAGAQRAGYVMLRLPYGVKDVFSAWLEEHVPGSKAKILERVKDMRGGKLNSPDFGARMRGEGIWAEQVSEMFRVSVAREGLNRKQFSHSVEGFHNPAGEQLSLL